MSRKNPKTHEIVLRCGTIVTMNQERPVLKNMDIHVQEGIIISIQPSRSCPAQYPDLVEFIDAEEALVIPGLVNAHTHVAMTLFRGLADDLPLRQWLFEKIFPAEAEHLSPETVYWGALLGCIEMIASGTTCFSDGYFFQGQTMLAAHKAGIRALIGQGVIDFPAPGVSDPKKNLEIGEQFIEKWLNFSDLLTPSLFCHSPVTCSEDTLTGALDICRSHRVPLQIHLSETQDEISTIVQQKGRRPVEYLDQLGLLSEDLIAAHVVHLDEREMAILRDRGVKVVHVPESNMKLASGVSRPAEMIRMGIPVGIGTDGPASNNDLDLLMEMDTAAKLSKVYTGDPTSLKAWAVLRMATIGGAAVLGLAEQIGSIEEGKRADMVVLDLQQPHLQPMYDPVSTVVYSASGGDVRDVIIDGKVIMKNREFVSLDTQEAAWHVRRIAENIHP